ncbi:Histidine protein methyltransferase 1 [Colletotrichum sidae]|uniref:protein-histidine N-methyltransferase n=3 Tax=Colletotrichum orbiculare species complex TaxID=2707354 RepID=A0A4R8RPS7_COLTR|nr:Histidine protein methyltransferase 1 [Colletotrichum spinosum]TDZ73235.1 Histidine protein methyltransferase 1 [Colletotrichum trifolii]TEA13650.1 Histidine protein methyltransferase 1 [Colletotrichum sidae]
MSFSFGFGGDDIEDDSSSAPVPTPTPTPAAPAPNPAASAFPVAGKPQLPPTAHDLQQMLAQLPSKIAFGTLEVTLDDGSSIQIPRRELWDVRLQLMAEDEAANGGEGTEAEGLGSHDVKTGVYEGGFKSWESSVDLVKVLASGKYLDVLKEKPLRLIELGCGTALPSLAIMQWAMRNPASRAPLLLTLADYNPTVLQLVTLPNFILAWALERRDQSPVLQEAFALEDELELTPEVLQLFRDFLASSKISLNFISGGWSEELVDLLYESQSKLDEPENLDALLLGAETIYSPFALDAFNEMVFAILSREQRERGACQSQALVGAKRLYFGVGGSLDDFIDKARSKGTTVTKVREEAEGVRRGVVRCTLSSSNL